MKQMLPWSLKREITRFARFTAILFKESCTHQNNGWHSRTASVTEKGNITYTRTTAKPYCHVFQWLRLVNRFIGSSLVVTTTSSYTLKITVTIAHATSHTKSSDSPSGRTAAPLELRNSSEVNSQIKVKVTLRLTVSQSVCLGVEPRLGLMTKCLWREVGSVICQS
jgi:hypothetical protein